MSKRTILVVEDERPLLKAIKNKIEESSMEVVTARSVNQAIEYLENLEKVDAVWLDHYLLGQENGLDFVAKIKEEDKWSSIPVFVVTNTGSHDKESTYLRLGAHKYFVKSNFRLDNIVQEIRSFLDNPD